MAESFAFNIAEKVLEKLGVLVLQEICMAYGIKHDLEKIKDTITTIKAVLLDAEEKRSMNNHLSLWLEKIKDIFYGADDILDEFEYETLRQKVANRGTIMEKVRHFFSCSNPIVFHFRVARKIKAIKERLNEVANERSQFGLMDQDIERRVVYGVRETYSFLDSCSVIGRENDKEMIINLLMGSNDHESISVIPIVGIGGMGKTTVAKMVYNEKRVIKHFEVRKWVCVSDDFNGKKLIANIVAATDYEKLEKDWLVTQLKDTLNDKRYLLVLDDVWNDNPSEWWELRDLLAGGAYGSKIIVTTRIQKVASIMSPTSSYNLQGLPNEDCISLFIKCAFVEGQDKQYQNLVEIGKDILKKCGGVPLAIRTLGSLLYMNTDEHEWSFVRDNDIWNLEQKENDILPALKLSYYHLPSHLKQCFASCSIFPKDYVFDNEELICLWMAEGLIQSTDQNLELEDIGMRYVTELLSRSFFQDFSENWSWYDFKMHDLMHDLALSVTKNKCSILNSNNQKISKNVRQVSFCSVGLMENFPNFLLQLKNLRTILMPLREEKPNINKSFVDMCLSRFKCLRVLHLRGCQFEVLPSSIGDLKHLRLLNLRDNQIITSLPYSICKLQCLQTLQLAWCFELKELPRNIGDLISLRYVSLTTQETLLSKERVGRWTSLRILYILDCSNLVCVEGMQNLAALRTVFILHCPNLVYLPLRYLRVLENLVIWDCEKLDLMMMDDQRKEKDIQLGGGFSRLRFLGIIRISHLEALPQWLQGASKTLKHIRILDCYNFTTLPEWMAEFKSLQKLEISYCNKLTSLPEGMHHLTSLKEIHIEGCDELTGRCQREIGEDWHKISHVPNIYLDEIKI